METEQYVADPSIATSVFIAQSLERPLLVEGRAGVGKTEMANVMARLLCTNLIRLQCYEGIDINMALYEWNYYKQLLWIKLNELGGQETQKSEIQIFSKEFLLERPLLAALTQPEKGPVLLIDEIDRADEEFEAFLLEVLSEFQVSIPELGTIKALNHPFVILTSNRSRELSDALRRRCMYLWIDYPDLEKELRIVRAKIPEIESTLATQICQFVMNAREIQLEKSPGISETLDWARSLVVLNLKCLDAQVVEKTMGAFIKDADDLERMRQGSIEFILEKIS